MSLTKEVQLKNTDLEGAHMHLRNVSQQTYLNSCCKTLHIPRGLNVSVLRMVWTTG